MEVVDDIDLQTQASKFHRVSSNTSTTTTDNNNNININNNNNNNINNNHIGWPSSRIVRVSRASGGKDRHSKVLTSKGLRDRRVRLSVSTAIQFYDLQDRLGCDQPSKAVEWLLKAAASSIDELPSLDPPFVGVSGGGGDVGVGVGVGVDVSVGGEGSSVKAKSPTCSSTSETSKGSGSGFGSGFGSGSGSGLSLSRFENRSKARERARVRVRVSNPVGDVTPESSSFTDLLTGGIHTTGITASRMPMDYFFNNHHQNHQFSFLQDGFTPAAGGGNGGGSYNLNFAMASSSTGGVVAPGGYRGTLQSNLQHALNLPHHHHLQSVGSTPANPPFYIGPNVAVDHYAAAGGYHVNYGGDDHKEKSKN